MKALLRRSSLEKIESEPEDKITAGDLIINNTSREVYMEGKPVFLSLKEFELLYLCLLYTSILRTSTPALS